MMIDFNEPRIRRGKQAAAWPLVAEGTSGIQGGWR